MTAQRELRYVDSGGLQIAYEVLGDGPIDIVMAFESGSNRDLVVGSGLEFEDRGEHELKGVPGGWRVLAVV